MKQANGDPFASPRVVTVATTTEGVRLAINDESPVVAQTWAEAARLAAALPEVENPLVLQSEDFVDVDPTLRLSFLAAATPTTEVHETLGELAGEGLNEDEDEDDPDWPRPEITINGERWRWFWSGTANFDSWGAWRLVPVSPQVERVLLKGGLGDYNSIAASTRLYGVDAYDDVLVSWRYAPDWDDTWWEVRYGEPSESPVESMLNSEYGEYEDNKMCPYCEALPLEQTTGLPGFTDWISLDPSIDASVLAIAVFDRVYEVCDKHAATEDPVSMAGHRWVHKEDHWQLCD